MLRTSPYSTQIEQLELPLILAFGLARKLLDTGRLSSLGWKASIGLQEGLAVTYQWYLTQDRHRGDVAP